MFFRTTIMLMTGLLLASCATESANRPKMSFDHLQPFFMTVSSSEFIDEYKEPQKRPYIEHLMVYSPTDAMRVWVRDRLKAHGGDNTMRVIIREASVTETDVSNTLDAFNVFGDGEDVRYDAKLSLEIRMYGDSALSEANVTVSASRSLSVPSSASAAERQNYQHQIIKELMDVANAELEKNLYQYMSNYISYSQNP